MKKRKYILGLDEAGRGCLAGPVFVAAVLFEENYQNDNIKDSKLLKPEKREFAYNIIKKDALFYQFYYLNNLIIDHIGISKAIYLLMNSLYKDLIKIYPDINFIAIIDGNYDPIKKDNTYSLIKADSKIVSVSAASIIAKVERDNYMKKISKFFPQYNFTEHKGYGTKLHIREIIKNGLSIIHRKSFKISSRALKYAES